MSTGAIECPSCGAAAPIARPGARITCRYCRAAFEVPGAPAASSTSGPGSIGASDAPIPQKGRDPLGGLVVKGIWGSIRTGHQLVYLPGRDRLLDWETGSGRYHVWEYDRARSSGDPLPNAAAEGEWSSIGSGHELIALGGDHVLDWESDSGAYRVWFYDAGAHGARDVFPSIVTKGTWSSIARSKRLVSLGGDRLLDWEPSTGAYRIWHYDRSARGGDPLPGGPVTEGTWQSIREAHELVYLGSDLVLDWTPHSGNYRLWGYDRNARGNADPFPREVAAGNWSSIREGHQLIGLEGQRVLDWEPGPGAYRIWAMS